MKYKVLFSETAYRDLEQLRAYLRLTQSEGYLGKVLDRVELLITFPQLGHEMKNPILDYARCRFLLTQNHVVIYQINELARAVYVLRVLSHYQNWKDVLVKELLLQRGELVSDGPWSVHALDETMVYDYYCSPPSWLDFSRTNRSDWTLQDAEEEVAKVQAGSEKENGPFIYAVFFEKCPKGYLKLVKSPDNLLLEFSFPSASKNELFAILTLFLRYLKGKSSIRPILAAYRSSDKISEVVLQQCGFGTMNADAALPRAKGIKIATLVTD